MIVDIAIPIELTWSSERDNWVNTTAQCHAGLLVADAFEYYWSFYFVYLFCCIIKIWKVKESETAQLNCILDILHFSLLLLQLTLADLYWRMQVHRGRQWHPKWTLEPAARCTSQATGNTEPPSLQNMIWKESAGIKILYKITIRLL